MTTDIYLRFECGRRDSGSSDCRICGTPIHQRIDPTTPDYEQVSATLPWYDGHGETTSLNGPSASTMTPGLHTHTPASAQGPTFGPYNEFVQATYATLRDPDGEVIAYLDTFPGSPRNGDWIIETGDHAGESYSDIVLYTATQGAQSETLHASGDTGNTAGSTEGSTGGTEAALLDGLTDDQHEALDEIVHDVASRIASGVINSGDHQTWLHAQGWTTRDIRHALGIDHPPHDNQDA